MYNTIYLNKYWTTFPHEPFYPLPEFIFPLFSLHPLRRDCDCQECFATSRYEIHCGSFSVRQRYACSAACSSTPPSSCSGLGLLCLRAWKRAPSTKREQMKIFVSTQVALARAHRCLGSRRQLADTCSQQIALADFCCSCRLRHRHLAWGRCCTGRRAVRRTCQPGAAREREKIDTGRKQTLRSTE